MDIPNEQKEQVEQVQDKNIKAQPQGSTHKNFILIGLGIVLILGAAITGGYFLEVKKEEPKACTNEAMVCPDGSAVGRTGPNCEFPACPTTPTPTSIDQTSNWKTYIDEKRGFSLKYPSNLNAQKGNTIYIGNKNKSIDNPFTISEEWDPEDCRALCPSISKRETVKISGIAMRKLEGELNQPSGWRSTFTKYVIKAKNYTTTNMITYVITSYYDVPGKIPNQREVFNEILSTFKFTPLSTSKVRENGCDWKPPENYDDTCMAILGYWFDGNGCRGLGECTNSENYSLVSKEIPFNSFEECQKTCSKSN